ncbi:hypothetical protein V1511DRAFT_492377 [Dipodascopsis uninucleata]
MSGNTPLDEEREKLRSVVKYGFLYGAMTGAVIASFSIFGLNNISSRFRGLPASIKSFLAISIIATGAVLEQDKRARQHLYLRHWEEELGVSFDELRDKQNKDDLGGSNQKR